MPNTSQSYNPPTLKTKSQLNIIITNKDRTPDFLAINIYYDSLRSWYAPKKQYQSNGNVVQIKKLKTQGIYSQADSLAKTHGVSKETIRKKLVKLEKLGLIQRSFQHKLRIATNTYNQRIIFVLQNTPYFFNSHGVAKEEIQEITPQTNAQYIEEKHGVVFASKTKQISTPRVVGGIHTLEDTKELIEPFNKLKDRSNESNFCKNNFSLSSKISKPELDKNTENLAGGFNRVVTEDNAANDSEDKLTRVNSNGFLGKGKYLKDMLDHLTDEMCSTLRSSCGRDFTDRAIREIVKAVSRSKKGGAAFFYHIKGFVSYLSKILSFEKRDPVKTSDTNYYITANQTNEEREIRKQEKYLTDIEYSLQVSPEWHLKKKLAAVLERSKVYNVLTSYESLKIHEGRAEMQLSRFVELSKMDKDIILQQIQATHESIDDDGNYQLVESFELAMPNKSTALFATPKPEQAYPKSHDTWGKIREIFAKSFANGGFLDKSWLSKLDAKIDKKQKTIILEAPSGFIKDWVENNYLECIEDAAKVNGLVVKIKCA